MARASNSQNRTNFKKPTANKNLNKGISSGLGESAEVIDIILDPSHPDYDSEKYPTRQIGDAKVRKLENFNLPTDQLEYVKPMLPNCFFGFPL